MAAGKIYTNVKEQVIKRKRGRPKGSPNKKKPIVADIKPEVKPEVVEVVEAKAPEVEVVEAKAPEVEEVEEVEVVEAKAPEVVKRKAGRPKGSLNKKGRKEKVVVEKKKVGRPRGPAKVVKKIRPPRPVDVSDLSKEIKRLQKLVNKRKEYKENREYYRAYMLNYYQKNKHKFGCKPSKCEVCDVTVNNLSSHRTTQKHVRNCKKKEDEEKNKKVEVEK